MKIRPALRRPRGLTLIEILVVIAIVAALATVTIMITSRAKKAAVSASTISNLREIGSCVAIWMSENGNFFPPAWDNNNGANRSYAQVLDPYMHNVESFRSTDSKFIGPNKRIPVEVNEWSHPITYTMNRAVCRDTTRYGSLAETLVHASRVSQPAEVILMADGCQNPANLGQANASAYRVAAAVGQTGPRSKSSDPIPVGTDADTPAGDGWFRYADGKCHALMCDGSAKVFKKGTILNRNIWIDSRDD